MTTNDQSAHPAPETAKVDATTIIQLGQGITLFGQLYLMIKSMKSNGSEGIPVQLTTSHGTLMINSNAIITGLLNKFQEIGDGLEKNNIDVSRVLDSLENQRTATAQSAASGGA